MTKRLEGKVALVTGSGNGIGKEIALKLASEGASVVVNDLGTNVAGEGASSAAADAVVAEIIAAGGKAVANYDSIADPTGCVNAVKTAVDAFGSCDIVIANAGALISGTLAGIQSDDDSWHKLLNLYLGQKFWLSRAAVPGMIERGWGRVIFATSEIARGTQSNPLGAVVMSGGLGLARDLANTYKDTGVTFNAYAPGAATRTFDLYKDQMDEVLRAQGIAEDEFGAFYLPPADRVAPMVTWLCTEAADAVSGEVFGVRGGQVTRWTQVVDGPILVKEGDERGLWTLDELDALVPAALFPENVVVA